MKQKLLALFILATFTLGIDACSESDDSFEPFKNGLSCELAEDCQSGLCVHEWFFKEGSQENVSFPNGFCTSNCNIWDDYDPQPDPSKPPIEPAPSSCAEDEFCMYHLGSNSHHCFQRCENRYNDHPSNNVCAERGDDWTCKCLGFVCQEAACLPPDIKGNHSLDPNPEPESTARTEKEQLEEELKTVLYFRNPVDGKIEPSSGIKKDLEHLQK